MNHREKILVVDSEFAIVETLRRDLERNGYAVATASDGHGAIASAAAERPDLIIMDVALPRLEGIAACKEIRKGSGVPIIMLSDRNVEAVTVMALEMGADDCISKPFSLNELGARVRARLRRPYVETPRSSNGVIASSGIVLDPSRQALSVRGRDVSLGPKQFSLLRLLMENSGRVMPRTTLLDKVWGYDFDGSHQTISVHMRWLREKVEVDANHPRLLITVRSRGYMFKDQL